MSAAYTTAHGNSGSLTHWARPGIEPETSWFLVGFVSTAPQRELLIHYCFKYHICSCLSLFRLVYAFHICYFKPFTVVPQFLYILFCFFLVFCFSAFQLCKFLLSYAQVQRFFLHPCLVYKDIFLFQYLFMILSVSFEFILRNFISLLRLFICSCTWSTFSIKNLNRSSCRGAVVNESD